MARARHPNKEIEAAVCHAEERGWELVRSGSHAWGILRCPHRGRDGHQMSVASTPRDPFGHAKKIRRQVGRCPHRPGETP